MKKEKADMEKEIEIAEEKILSYPDFLTSYVNLKEQQLKVIQNFLDMTLKEKTEITIDERTLLSIIQILANNPFPMFNSNMPRVVNLDGHKVKIEKVKSDVLNDFLNEYYSLGLSVNRKSRGEAVKILRSLLVGEKEDEDEIVEDERKKKLMR